MTTPSLFNLVVMTVSAAPGIGDVTLGAPFAPYLGLSNYPITIPDGTLISYSITDGSSNSEMGTAIYRTPAASSTSYGKLTGRSVTTSTAAGNVAIAASAAAVVRCSARTEDIIGLASTPTWIAKHTFAGGIKLSSPASNGITIPMAVGSDGAFLGFRDPCIDGADPTGTNDSSTAIAASLSVSNYIKLRPGTYKCNSALGYVFSGTGVGGLRIEGAGQESTVLHFPNATDGIDITFSNQFQSITIQDLTLETDQAGTNVGLNLAYATPDTNPANTAQQVLRNLTIRGTGAYGAANQYWGTAISVNNVSNIQYENIFITGYNKSNDYVSCLGNGILIENTNPGSGPSYGYNVVHNISRCTMNYCAAGLIYGQYVQGVTVNQCNMTGGNIGISVTSPGTSDDDETLAVTNNQFNVAKFMSIGSPPLSASAELDDIQITNNIMIVPSGCNMADLTGWSNLTFVGNVIGGMSGSGYGLILRQPKSGGVATVSANIFFGLGQYPVYLDTNCTGVTVDGSNVYANNGFNYASDNGTGNIVVDYGAWRTWTPTVTSGGGTLTTVGAVVARYQKSGKTIKFTINVTITTNGSGANNVNVTLPFTSTSAANQIVYGRDEVSTGKMLCGYIGASTAIVAITNYDFSYPGANGVTLAVSGTYECA